MTIKSRKLNNKKKRKLSKKNILFGGTGANPDGLFDELFPLIQTQIEKKNIMIDNSKAGKLEIEFVTKNNIPISTITDIFKKDNIDETQIAVNYKISQ